MLRCAAVACGVFVASVCASVIVAGCGSSPTPNPVAPLPASAQTSGAVVAFELTGVATGDDGRLVANARVSVNFQPESGHFVGTTGVTDGRGAYDLKFTAVPGGYLEGATALVLLVGDGYEEYDRYFRPVTHEAHQALDLHPRLIMQIAAGDSTTVTVSPDDTPCINNVQDFPGIGPDYACRIVRIVAPVDGDMTIEAVPAQVGTSAPLVETEIVPTAGSGCCDEDLGNPRTLTVAAGTVVKASVEIPAGSGSSQTFVLKTTFVRR